MAVAGSLTYDTKIDKNGFEKGINSLKSTTNNAFSQIKNIVTALGIDKLISSAFNLINNSIDGAISRLDTLNNYPKVMSNLGIASDDAQKSISKMSDKLSGLPTTLDEGALAVQRFTSANGDINKSTDYFLALNNAILAGGASADIQSTALEQLSQAYAKGKPDMMEWRSLMTAMPAQLKQVAIAMGYVSTDQLGEDLREGNVSMEAFMSTIVRLNTEGIDGFQSFEEQAKNSTGGIATSITVAKTQVVKGVADIIQSLDQFLKDEGLGGIGEIIANIGKRAKEVLDTVAQKLPDIIKFLQKISPLIITITTAFIVFKGALAIKGLIDGIKNSFLLLNAVMAANPIILIVSLIAGLVAGFIYLWNTSESFRNFWIGLWEGIKKAFETAWNAIKKFFTETIPEAFNGLLDKISEIGNNIKTFFENLWNGIVSFFTDTIPKWIKNVIDWFTNLPYMIGYQIGQLIGFIIQFGLNVWNWITVDLPKIIQGIIDWFAQLPERIWEWLVNAYNNILQWATDVYNNVTQWISNTINNIVTYFSELPQKIYSWLLDTLSKIIAWIQNTRAKMSEGIQSIINAVIQWFKELPRNMINIGKNIVEGLWNGIVNAKNWIVGKVKEFAKGILDGIKNSLGIHSPSTLFRDEVGRFIPQGIAVGIEADTDSAVKAIDNMNDEIISKMNRAVAVETGSINAKASIKSNNSMLTVINANFEVDGSVNIDGQRAGRILSPSMTKTFRVAGV